MALGLVRIVLESHGLAGRQPERELGAEAQPVDQVLLGNEEAPLVVAALERAGVETARVSPVVVDPGRSADAGDDELASDWRRGALGLGLLVPRPGHGDPRVLHREWLAAPGRLALCAGRLAAGGALGMLALKADALVAAAVLAGGPFTLEVPLRVIGVELTGELQAGTGGVDLALVLLSRLREAREPVDVLELGGAGMGTLAMADRTSAVWLLAEAGLSAILPSDEATRAELAALDATGTGAGSRRRRPTRVGRGA